MAYMVWDVDDDLEYIFVARSAFDACTKMVYYLNLAYQDQNARVLYSNATCWFVHKGKTFAALERMFLR